MAFDTTNLTATQVNRSAVVVAHSLCGVHGQRYGRMATKNEGLDCIGLIEHVASQLGAPVSIDRDWQTNGGDLPLVEIPVHLAEPGDVLVFDMGAHNRAFHRFQLGILIEGATTDPRAKFVGVPHAAGPVWLNAGPWKTSLIRAYRFGVVAPMKATQATPSKFDNYSNAQLADMLGEADALEKAAKAKTDEIKAELKARGIKEVVGDNYTVTITESLRETADTKALKEHFGDTWGRWTKIGYVQTTNIKAVATAALQRAA